MRVNDELVLPDTRMSPWLSPVFRIDAFEKCTVCAGDRKNIVKMSSDKTLKDVCMKRPENHPNSL
jgi:hypothetical protein